MEQWQEKKPAPAKIFFTDKDISAIPYKQWLKEKDWIGETMPIPRKFFGSDETTLKAWNTWLFLCGALKTKLRNACPDKKIPNRDKKVLFSFTADSNKNFTLMVHGAWARECLKLPKEMIIEADCPYKAYIEFMKKIL